MKRRTQQQNQYTSAQNKQSPKRQNSVPKIDTQQKIILVVKTEQREDEFWSQKLCMAAEGLGWSQK